MSKEEKHTPGEKSVSRFGTVKPGGQHPRYMPFDWRNFEDKNLKELLEGIIKVSTTAMAILKAIRNEKEEIIDFEYEWQNEPAILVSFDVIGMRMLEKFPFTKSSGLFDCMVKAVEKAIPTEAEFHYDREGYDLWLRYKIVKLNDGVLFSCEDITRQYALHQSEKMLRQLNASLEQQVTQRTMEINLINSDLKLFTSIAANVYSQTLHQLYINFEYIVTQDAKNISNSGKANLRRSQAAIQKLKLVTEDLIAYSKLHQPGAGIEPVNLSDILHTIVSELRALPESPEFEIECHPLTPINGYPLLLSILFDHLLDNAIKFRKPGTLQKIEVTANQLAAGEINHESARPGVNYTVISVVDEGIGFPASENEKIFDMYYRLNEKSRFKGSGIGLTICKKIMEIHHGFILAEGKDGRGAGFHCFFPAD